MANFAIISGNVIQNIVVAEDISVAQEAFPHTQHIIEVPVGLVSPGLGWSYNEETKEFIKPEVPGTV